MARRAANEDFTQILDAARRWIERCLVDDGSLFGGEQLWTPALIAEVRSAFVDHLDTGSGTFLEKLTSQMGRASPAGRRLMAEMLWALQLFPSNVKPATKRTQVVTIWEQSGQSLDPAQPLLADPILIGVGSAGPGFSTHRWRELAFLIDVARELKKLAMGQRRELFRDFDAFCSWLETVPRDGQRQFRHMVRFFAFPDLVERVSTAGGRREILSAFGVATKKDTKSWSDQQLDQALLALRRRLEAERPGQVLDFYDGDLAAQWLEPSIAETTDDYDPAPAPPETAVAGPINKILYGPPGTGKTFWLKSQFERYTEVPRSVDPAVWAQGVVARFGWRSVLAAALASLGKAARVPELRAHRWIQAKSIERARRPGSVQATLWGYLQAHAPETNELVNLARRQPPAIFWKNEHSEWTLQPDWRAEDPESAELFDLLQAGPGRESLPIRRYRTVTFHPSFTYEDFVRGIRPVSDDDGNTGFRLVDGVFKQVCELAAADPEHRWALFIDEINRANIAKVFGELITLIEPDKRIRMGSGGRPEPGVGMTVNLPGSGGGETAEAAFGVPENLDIYGTMNTADRSIALLDIALRRRFQFEECPPNYGLIEEEVEGIQLWRLLRRINDRLEFLLDRDHRIGHAYLIGVKSLDDLGRVFANQIVPLLQEYFFDDFSRVALVLTTSGPPFVSATAQSATALFGKAGSAHQLEDRPRYRIEPSHLWTAASFRGVYDETVDDEE